MNQLLAYFRFSSLDNLRHIRRFAAQNTVIFIGALVCLAIGIPLMAELAFTFREQISQFFPYVLFAYAVFKTLQDAPALNLKFSIFSFGMFSLTQFKTFLMIKMIAPTIVVAILCMVLGIPLSGTLLSSLIVNIGSNIFSILKTQLSHKSSTVIAIVFLFSSCMTIVFSVPIIAALLVLGLSVVILSRKYFTYDELYPYCQSQQSIRDALVNQDRIAISANTESLFKTTTKSIAVVKEKYYDSFFYFRIEASRIIDHRKGLISCCMISLTASLALLLFFKADIVVQALLACLMFFCVDSFLNLLNNIDSTTTSVSNVFYRKSSKLVSQKYIAHLLTVVVILGLGFGTFIGIQFLPLMLSVVLLPLQNIFASFAPSKPKLFLAYIMKSAVFALFIAGYLPQLIPLFIFSG